MKIKHETFLIRSGEFAASNSFDTILKELRVAIKEVTWNSKTEFNINPIRKGNGVKPIKNDFVSELERVGWKSEQRMSLAKGMNPGPIDIIKETEFGIFAVEWETGNISSSHRALNKLTVGILQEQIIGGMLILPIKALARYLTDRVGNYEEISPYFPVYQNLNIIDGVFGIIGVEHHNLDPLAPLIQKGKDGNAKK